MKSAHHRSPLLVAADSISGFDDPSMGDERQRDVILRAYTFAMVVGTYTSFIAAILLAAVGVGLWSVVVILASGGAGWSAIWYCSKENVNMTALFERVGTRRKRITYGSIAGLSAVWISLNVFHTLAGAPLIPVAPTMTLDSTGDILPTALGAAVGAVIGLALVVLAMKLIGRSARRREEHAEDD